MSETTKRQKRADHPQSAAPPADERSFHESFARASDGTRLYVRRRGDPSAVTSLLCDGLVCDGFIFKYLWDDLSRHTAVAHFNYRGHGRSALPEDPLQIDVPALAGDLNSVRAHLGDPPIVLVGHSLGTQVALEAYRARADRVAAMVFLCGSFGRVTHTFKGSDLLANVLPNLIEFVTRHPKLARALWARVPPKVAIGLAKMIGDVDGNAVDEADVEPYFQHVAHVDFEMFLRMLQAAGEHSAEDLLESVAVPVLVIAGERDTFTPPELSTAMAERLPDSELCVVSGGTHVAPLEHRREVLEAIEKFLGNKRILA